MRSPYALRPLCLVFNEPAAWVFVFSNLRHLPLQKDVAVFKKGAPRWPIIFRMFSSHHSLDVSCCAPWLHSGMATTGGCCLRRCTTCSTASADALSLAADLNVATYR